MLLCPECECTLQASSDHFPMEWRTQGSACPARNNTFKRNVKFNLNNTLSSCTRPKSLPQWNIDKEVNTDFSFATFEQIELKDMSWNEKSPLISCWNRMAESKTKAASSTQQVTYLPSYCRQGHYWFLVQTVWPNQKQKQRHQLNRSPTYLAIAGKATTDFLLKPYGRIKNKSSVINSTGHLSSSQLISCWNRMTCYYTHDQSCVSLFHW